MNIGKKQPKRPNQSNQPNQPNQPKPRTGSGRKLSLLLQALDGYSNAAAFLGDDSPLLSSGTFTRNSLTRDLPRLTAMYRSNWLCKRIIDMPVEDATWAWYSLDSSMAQEELDDPDFGLPEFYEVNVNLGSRSGTLRLHHSRVLRFIGPELPNLSPAL